MQPECPNERHTINQGNLITALTCSSSITFYIYYAMFGSKKQQTVSEMLYVTMQIYCTYFKRKEICFQQGGETHLFINFLFVKP